MENPVILQENVAWSWQKFVCQTMHPGNMLTGKLCGMRWNGQSQEELVSRGMIADFAIHDPVRPKGAEPNPHIHILVPIRPLKEDGTWGIKERKEDSGDG